MPEVLPTTRAGHGGYWPQNAYIAHKFCLALTWLEREQMKAGVGCAGRNVLELGSGVSPLCCMAALRHCRRYVATDGSLQACQGLVRNLDLNCRYYMS